uniref:Candidate secreted effector n=1 Tax=Meloidogyne incognita TaxID=6306 RepID=A0A914KHN3_MELIC
MVSHSFEFFRTIYILSLPIFMTGPPGPPASACPGGPALPIECDPKRPWPQCPPQSYCYATNSVDIGPYYCCPVWSTYGAAWRPATPFYNYVPPPPPNWAEPAMQMAASPRFGPFRKNLKEQNSEENIKEEPEEIQNTQKSLRRL